MEKYRENPPPEKLTAISGLTLIVPPTLVTKGQLEEESWS